MHSYPVHTQVEIINFNWELVNEKSGTVIYYPVDISTTVFSYSHACRATIVTQYCTGVVARAWTMWLPTSN